jgi:hypothetical protein
VLARGSYGYQLPGDLPEDGTYNVEPLQFDLSHDPVTSDLVYRKNDAATLEYRFQQPGGLSVTTSYSNRLDKDFVDTGALGMDGFWGVQIESPGHGNLPELSIDFSVGGFNGENGDEFGDSEHHKIHVKSKSQVGPFAQGVSYKMVGSDYEVVDENNKSKGKDGGEEIVNTWIGKSFGKLFVSQFVEQRRANVHRPDKAEIIDDLAGNELQYTWLSWPYVGTSFSHATGKRESAEGYSVGLTSTTGTLSASHNKWSADLAVSETRPDGAGGYNFGESNFTNYYVGGSYYPDERLIITPYLNRSVERYQDYGVETERISKAMSVVYRPTETNYNLTFFVSQDDYENLDWGMDSTYLYSYAGIEWDLGGPSNNRSRVSLSVDYSQYLDEVYTGTNSKDFSIKITFKSYSMQGLLLQREVFRPDINSFMAGLTPTTFDIN